MPYKKKNDIVERAIAGETLLVPIRGRLVDLQRLFVLEGAGKFIWDRLDGDHSAGEVAGAVSAHYDIAVQDAQNDVNEFAGELIKAGLIEET